VVVAHQHHVDIIVVEDRYRGFSSRMRVVEWAAELEIEW
jgi:hypothetical protein